MISIKERYINAVKDGDQFLKEIGFNDFLEMNSVLLNNNGFYISNSENEINMALEEREAIWNSKKSNKIIFMPASVNINYNLELNEKLNKYTSKDNKSNEWKSINKTFNEEVIEVKILRSSIDVNEIIKNYNNLKIKEGYILQIYKLRFNGMEKAQIFAFKNDNVLADITSENLITNDFEIVNLKFQEAEKSYLDAIEGEDIPEYYLQLVLLNNKLNEICNYDTSYELITERTLVKEHNLIIEAPNFYYDDNGKATIEYFKKYNTYKGAYKRVVNSFEKKDSRFKIVDQFVALYM
jgi:hypothetical protein